MSIFNRKLKKRIEDLKDEVQIFRQRKWKEEKYDYDLMCLQDEYRRLKDQIKRDSLRYAIESGASSIALVKIAQLIETYLTNNTNTK